MKSWTNWRCWGSTKRISWNHFNWLSVQATLSCSRRWMNVWNHPSIRCCRNKSSNWMVGGWSEWVINEPITMRTSSYIWRAGCRTHTSYPKSSLRSLSSTSVSHSRDCRINCWVMWWRMKDHKLRSNEMKSQSRWGMHESNWNQLRIASWSY